MKLCLTLRSCTHFTQGPNTLRTLRGANIFFTQLYVKLIFITQIYTFLRILRRFTHIVAVHVLRRFTQVYAAERVLCSFTHFTQLNTFYADVRVLRSFTHFTQMYMLYADIRTLHSSTRFTQFTQLILLYEALRNKLFESFTLTLRNFKHQNACA